MSATAEFRLDDLVANRTLSPAIAATLRATVRARRPFLVLAVPRFAGKSTLTRAMLAELPRHAPVRTLGHDGDDLGALLGAARGGYVVIPEVSRGAWAPGYVWGAPVRRAFRSVSDGTGLATALHAGSADEAFEVLCRGNGLPDEDAAKLKLVIYLRSLGPDPAAPERRVAATVHEVLGVERGVPHLELIHRWDEARDRFVSARPATR